MPISRWALRIASRVALELLAASAPTNLWPSHTNSSITRPGDQSVLDHFLHSRWLRRGCNTLVDSIRWSARRTKFAPIKYQLGSPRRAYRIARHIERTPRKTKGLTRPPTVWQPSRISSHQQRTRRWLRRARALPACKQWTRKSCIPTRWIWCRYIMNRWCCRAIIINISRIIERFKIGEVKPTKASTMKTTSLLAKIWGIR